MTEKINIEEIVETGRRNLEKNLFENNRVIMNIQEVRRDESGNFVPVSKTDYRKELSGNDSISILVERYIRKVYPGESETEPKEPIVLERGGITYVVGVRKEIVVREVRGSRESIIGHEIPSLSVSFLQFLLKEGYDEMIRQEVKLYMKRVGGIINRRYALAIKNVGGKGQVIKVYDERGNKIGDIDSGEELVVGKGTYYLEFPGAYLLEGPDYSIADKNVFLKITLS